MFFNYMFFTHFYNPVFITISLNITIMFMLCPMYIVFKKLGLKGIYGIIPFYNGTVLCEKFLGEGTACLYAVCSILTEIPLIGPVFVFGSRIQYLFISAGMIWCVLTMMILCMLSEQFGKSTRFTAGLIALPMVFMPMLAIGKVIEKK